MAEVERLVTVVDEDAAPPGSEGFSAHLFAVLADGSRVLVLDDRGWAQTTIRAARPPDTVDPAPAPLDRADVEDTARTVVGPDEPADGEDHEAEAARYWQYLTEILAGRGVDVPAARLRTLPHDVELTEALAARVR